MCGILENYTEKYLQKSRNRLIIHIRIWLILKGRVQFPTGGKVREPYL